MRIATVKNLEIHWLEFDHVEPLYGLFCEVPPKYPFLSDPNKYILESLKTFAKFALSECDDILVVLKQDQIVGCCYLTHLTVGHMANMHVVTRAGSSKPAQSKSVGRWAIKHFMQAHRLQKLQGLIEQSNRPAQMYALGIGMQKDGRVRCYARHGGVSRDYYVYSILDKEIQNG
jgi:RimJ/RimL family protein N-acetyltransferase